MTDAKKRRTEFGDFQTPRELARLVCSRVSTSGFLPRSILEPTCGQGSFLRAALEAFPQVQIARAVDINPDYVCQARRAAKTASESRIQIEEGDFFLTDWKHMVSSLPEPLLIVGNPPWVTNSVLGVLQSTNLPIKSNADNLRGVDALMGKSNFDISEWMFREYVGWLDGKRGLLAVLCKTSVARKVLRTSWSSSKSILDASVYRIDSKKFFDVAVDACALVIRFAPEANCKECSVFDSLDSNVPVSTFGMRDGRLLSDVGAYDKWHHLAANGLSGWRSGVKHDCSKIFELTRQNETYTNGFGERFELESELMYPLLKSSDLARGRQPRKWMLVPHRSMQEDVSLLREKAPKVWRYLESHKNLLEKRGSSIYRSRHSFSIFGVGAYSFAPWKVATSGLYKELRFVKVPRFEGRPVVLDDTCYAFPCQAQEECDLLSDMLSSAPAREFLTAFVFWDSKRPITAEILNRLDLKALGTELNNSEQRVDLLARRQNARLAKRENQQVLFT